MPGSQVDQIRISISKDVSPFSRPVVCCLCGATENEFFEVAWRAKTAMATFSADARNNFTEKPKAALLVFPLCLPLFLLGLGSRFRALMHQVVLGSVAFRTFSVM